MTAICQRCGRYLSADHQCPPEQCPARWPGLNGPGHWCEVPATEPHDHHDVIDWAGPWLRWCDYPLTCDRPDCDLSAYNASREARIRRNS